MKLFNIHKLIGSLFFIGLFNISYAQYNWIRKKDFPGISRAWSVTFSIGQKGYITTGSPGTTYLKDLWEYDVNTDSWTQKADFPGAGRAFAFGFSINGKGYVCLGSRNAATIMYNDVWEYEPTSDKWTQKTNFPGQPRDYGISFSIGTKGYVGCGRNVSSNTLNDFWEYDPSIDKWNQLDSIPPSGRVAAVGFSLGNKGYVGFGHSGSIQYNDFWEYDPISAKWFQKLAGINYYYSGVTFPIVGKVFLGSGFKSSPFSLNENFWEYNTLSNSWSLISPFPSFLRHSAAYFSIGLKGYMALGDTTSNWSLINELWEFSLVKTPDTLNSDFSIPNIFTPNNDNTNDVFKITNLPEGSSVNIYNRWGVKVKELKDSRLRGNDNVIWDGRTTSGQACTEGVYYYSITFPTGENQSGFLHLFR